MYRPLFTIRGPPWQRPRWTETLRQGCPWIEIPQTETPPRTWTENPCPAKGTWDQAAWQEVISYKDAPCEQNDTRFWKYYLAPNSFATGNELLLHAIQNRVPIDQGNQGNFWRLFPVREIREKTGGFSAKIRGKIANQGTFFQTIFKPFKPLNRRKMFLKCFLDLRSCQEIALNEAIFA